MNTRFPAFSAQQPLFTGSPTPKPSSQQTRYGFETPPTPDTIKTDEDTVKEVQGAQDRLKELLKAGVLESADYDTFSKALEKSEETGNRHKEDGRTLYTKLIDTDNQLQKAEEENEILKRQNRNLKQSMATNAQSNSKKQSPSPFQTRKFQAPQSLGSIIAAPTKTAQTPQAGDTQTPDTPIQ